MNKTPASRLIIGIRIFLLVLIIIGGILILFQKRWVPSVVAYILSVQGRADYVPYEPATIESQPSSLTPLVGNESNLLEKGVATSTEKDLSNSKVLVEGVRWSADSFIKPSKVELQKRLTAIQYNVTQEDGTETPYNNIYNKNYAEGIYVDIVSGEPLFFSKDKYESGTGWPSFVKPISDSAVVLKDDYKLLFKRTDVRSRYANSHLGHVFTDGPVDRGGNRYCMNSASLRFVATADMAKEGYAYLIPQVR